MGTLVNSPEEFRKHDEHVAIVARTQPQATTLDRFLSPNKTLLQ